VAAGAELEEALEPFAPSNWTESLGSSGTVGAVSQVLLANRITDGHITTEGLRWLMEQCLIAGRIERLALLGLKEDRRAVIAGGLSILYTLATQFGVKALVPARGALRQGVIFDLDERLNAIEQTHDAEDMRDSSVRELQRRFLVDEAQATRVGEVAQTLYASVQPTAGRDAQRELHWACALHELGMMVSHHDHHRHSAYVIGHVDAPGFSQSQQRRLAELVLAQRGGLRKVESSLMQPDFAWQAMCLRLAIIKCHARGPIDSHAIALRRAGNTATLSWQPGWYEKHPHTHYLLNEEMSAWQRSAILQLELPRVPGP